MQILILADHDNTSLSSSCARLVSAARAIGGAVNVLVAGNGCTPVAAAAAMIEGVDRVLLADDALYENGLAEPLAEILAHLAGSHQIVMASTGSTSKDVMPRAAALSDAPQISDVLEVCEPDIFIRSAHAGNALETVRTQSPLTFLTVRASSFDTSGEGGSAAIENLDYVPTAAASRFVELVQSQSERPDLGVARIVVSGGRAFGSRERFEDTLGPLADKLNAAIGASRAAVDAGYVSNDLQVGQTGRIVAPDLYIACGISGAVQHIAGIKGSKVIVAINSDPDATIFEYADYGLVADVFSAVQDFTNKL